MILPTNVFVAFVSVVVPYVSGVTFLSYVLGFGVWGLGFAARFRNSDAYASAAAREPRSQPITTPTSSTPGMNRKCAAVGITLDRAA